MKTFLRYFLSCCFILFLQQATAFASDVNRLLEKLEQATAFEQKAETYQELILTYSNEQLDSSIFYFEEAEIRALRNMDFRSYSELVGTMTRILFDKGMYVEVKNYLDKALVIAHQNDDQYLLVDNLRRLGNWNWELSNLKQAYNYYQEALTLSESLNDPLIKANTLLSFGLLYAETGEQEKEKEAQLEALEIFESANDSLGQALILNNLGYSYLKIEEYAKALEVLNKGLELKAYSIKNDPALYELSFAMKGRALYRLDKKKQALEIMDEAIKMAIENGHLRNQIIFNQMYARIYILEEEYDYAIEHAEKAVDLCEGTPYVMNLPTLCEFLITSYKSLNQFDQALEWIKKKNEVVKEMAQKEKKEEIRKAVANYEIEQKELENQLLLLRNKSNKNIISIIIALSIIVSLIIFYYSRKKQRFQVEQFRQRIAADLHDDVGSKLNKITRMAKDLHHNAPVGDPSINQINLLINESNAAIQNVVDVIWALDQEESELDFLIEKMEEFLGRTKANHQDLQVSFENKNINPRFPLSMKVKHHLLKAFQEAIDFVVLGSKPQQIKVLFQEMNQSIQLDIEHQFDESPTFKVDADHLAGIKKRITTLGGKMELGINDKHITWQIELNKKS